MARLVRVLKIALGILLVAVVGLAVAAIVLDEPRPEGRPGPAADALARRMMEAANVQAFEALGAVKWTFGGRREHLWDKHRGLARVRWGEHEVLLDLGSEVARATLGGEVLSGEAAQAARAQAYEAWVNDSFWLNPLPKLFDPGVERSIVELDGAKALMVTFSEGGVTPGDAYVFRVGPDGLPTAWRMWVGIIPTGGLVSTWERWLTLPGGAKVATRHEGVATLELTDVEAGPTAAALEGGADPFAPLLERSAARPASRPAAAPEAETSTRTAAPPRVVSEPLERRPAPPPSTPSPAPRAPPAEEL